MGPLLSRVQISLNLTRLLIQHVENLYPEQDDGADRFLFVLHTYEKDVLRRINDKPATSAELIEMKAAIREAGDILADIHENEPERMTHWYAGCKPTNPAQHIANVLVSTLNEMSWNVLANEQMRHNATH